jgi:hypothetical protein
MRKKMEGSIYSSRDFKWDAERTMFIAPFSKVPKVLRSLCREDMTLGFGIRSARTGSVVWFVLEDMQYNPEGKPTSWLFLADNPHKQKGLQGLTAKVLNDL